MRWLNILVALLTLVRIDGIPTNDIIEEERPKRDLKYINSLLLGNGEDSKTKTTESLQPVIFATRENYRIFRIPGYKKLLVKEIPKQTNSEDFSESIEMDPKLALISAYLGTSNKNETIQSLQRMENLLQSGVLSDKFNISIENLPTVEKNQDPDINIFSIVNNKDITTEDSIENPVQKTIVENLQRPGYVLRSLDVQKYPQSIQDVKELLRTQHTLAFETDKESKPSGNNFADLMQSNKLTPESTMTELTHEIKPTLMPEVNRQKQISVYSPISIMADGVPATQTMKLPSVFFPMMSHNSESKLKSASTDNNGEFVALKTDNSLKNSFMRNNLENILHDIEPVSKENESMFSVVSNPFPSILLSNKGSVQDIADSQYITMSSPIQIKAEKENEASYMLRETHEGKPILANPLTVVEVILPESNVMNAQIPSIHYNHPELKENNSYTNMINNVDADISMPKLYSYTTNRLGKSINNLPTNTEHIDSTALDIPTLTTSEYVNNKLDVVRKVKKTQNENLMNVFLSSDDVQNKTDKSELVNEMKLTQEISSLNPVTQDNKLKLVKVNPNMLIVESAHNRNTKTDDLQLEKYVKRIINAHEPFLSRFIFNQFNHNSPERLSVLNAGDMSTFITPKKISGVHKFLSIASNSIIERPQTLSVFDYVHIPTFFCVDCRKQFDTEKYADKKKVVLIPTVQSFTFKQLTQHGFVENNDDSDDLNTKREEKPELSTTIEASKNNAAQNEDIQQVNSLNQNPIVVASDIENFDSEDVMPKKELENPRGDLDKYLEVHT